MKRSSVLLAQAVARDLAAWLAVQEGQRVSAVRIGPFYDKYPEHKAAVRAIGGLTALCQAFPCTLQLQANPKAHLRVVSLAVPSSCSQQASPSPRRSPPLDATDVLDSPVVLTAEVRSRFNTHHTSGLVF